MCRAGYNVCSACVCRVKAKRIVYDKEGKRGSIYTKKDKYENEKWKRMYKERRLDKRRRWWNQRIGLYALTAYWPHTTLYSTFNTESNIAEYTCYQLRLNKRIKNPINF